MKRKLTVLLVCMFTAAAFAQQENEEQKADNIDWQEDSTEIVTVKDIVRDQQAVTMRNSLGKHFQDVWGRRSYLDLTYTTMKLTPDEDIPTGVNYYGGYVPEFKSKWGFTLKWGRNYRVHKSPIANVAQINIDYTWIDLNVSNFEAEPGLGKDGKGLYNSATKWYYDESAKKDQQVTLTSASAATDINKYRNDGKFYSPWNLEKYEVDYGMSLGPSITLAPFTYINVPELHYFKFNIYYHIGYHVSAILMKSDSDADLNPQTDSPSGSSYTSSYSSDPNQVLYDSYDTLKDNLKLDWGHGMTQSFGFSFSWRVIGFGFETRNASLEYTSVSPSEFGDRKYKFKSTLNRVYLQFRF